VISPAQSAPGGQIIVIGGGVAGLVAALELARAGHRVLVLEAAGTFGGIVSAHSVGGLTLDAGAESFATARPAVAQLIGDLGLADRICAPNPVGAWVRHRAGAAPLPTVGFLGIPGRPTAADVRRVIGWPGVLRTAIDAVLPARGGLPADATLGSVVRSRLGRRVLDRLVEPVAGGVYAADPDTLEISSVAPGLPQAFLDAGSLAGAARLLRGGGERPGSAVATLSGGLHTVVPALVRAVEAAGGWLRTGAAVRGLSRHQAGWSVLLADGSELAAATVLLALPAPQTAELLGGALPGLTTAVLTAPITPVRICTLVLDDHRLDAAPRGTGVLVSARATGVTAKALTHATAKWPWLAELAGPGRHVLRLSYGRGSGASLPDPGVLPTIALADAAELLGVRLAPAAVVDTAVVEWSSALPAPRPGHAAAVREMRQALAASGLYVVGAAVAGSGLAGVVTDAHTQAAALVLPRQGVQPALGSRSPTVSGG
jgi:oxygen-dependent protoporphyrinogen oxidase